MGHGHTALSLAKRKVSSCGFCCWDLAKRKGYTQVIALLENAAAIAAQVGPSTYRHNK